MLFPLLDLGSQSTISVSFEAYSSSNCRQNSRSRVMRETYIQLYIAAAAGRGSEHPG